MSVLKPRIIGVFRDRTANNLMVALLIAFSLSNLVMFAAESLGVPGWSSWWSVTWRQLAAFGISLVLAEIVSRFAR